MPIKHEEWVRRQRRRELTTLPIPHEHRDKRLRDVRRHDGNEVAIEAITHWLSEPSRYLSPSSPEAGKGILLFGPPGTGKTLLASVMANEMVRRANRTGLVHFVSMEGFNRHRLRKMELERALGREVNDEWWDHDAAIQRCYEVRFLVLDDIGQENTTPHLARVLNELLRDRYNRGCPTVITSNADPHEWEDCFDSGSLASFVFQASEYVVPVTGEDERRAIG